MKKLIQVIIVVIVPTIILAQEKLSRDNLKFRSIETGFGVYHSKLRDDNLYDHSGPTFNVFFAMSYKKNIFSFQLESGTELVIVNFGGDPELQGFYGVNLLYGRELELARWFKIEGNVGMGLYHHKAVTKGGATDRKNVLGIPINTKLLFYPAERFAFGLSPAVNFNSINTTYSGNLVFKYKFN
ncbi:hypothetical protein [uncultured Aquimarina sp.]|uniref:hypothetical protein n=1 Tax=uncultured Aquimarina sp. TaxID=575652 RepID=UPI002618F104|nr:hypothetical protein [uncultured Aquimarina sp.]